MDVVTFAAQHGIAVDYFPMKSKGFCLMDEGQYFIAVNATLPNSEKLDVILHELGHILTGSDYTESESDSERLRKEYNAIKWANENRYLFDGFADII